MAGGESAEDFVSEYPLAEIQLDATPDSGQHSGLADVPEVGLSLVWINRSHQVQATDGKGLIRPLPQTADSELQ